MEPLTPNNQLPYHESMKLILNAPASPTKSRSPDAGVAKQDEIRPDIGFYNNADMFVCPIDPFLLVYGPSPIDDAKVQRCMTRMAKKSGPGRVLNLEEDGSYTWAAFKVHPKDSGVHEDMTFEPLGKIVKSVLIDRTNKIFFHLVPNTELASDIRGSTHKIDACFVEGAFLSPPLQNRKVVSPVEVKKYRNKWMRALVNLQILGACHHILNEDVRRMWAYGLTFEDSMASVWYFSRSHSVKSIAFDWIKQPALLVKVLLMFACATPEQLGIDPTVHIGPASRKGRKDVSFVYEVPGKNNETLYFKTGKSWVPQRSLRIAGRTTRVWEVTQVTAADGKTEVSGKKVILKDVWLDDSDDHSKTEAENMDAIFKAVDKMVKDGLDAEIKRELKSNPGATRAALLADSDTVTRLTRQFINRDTRFGAFDTAAKERLCDNLTNKKYRSLFLTKLYAWQGNRSKAVCPDASRFPHFFHPKPIDEKNVEKQMKAEYAKSRGMGIPDASVHTLTSQLELVQFNVAQEDDRYRRFAPKRQSRFLYEEVCTTLENLATVGDVVDVLCQTVDALHILFAAGWVHRDVSSRNVMAYRLNEGQPWTVKLADLEFSRRMIDPERPPRTDPRTGTPYFMPVEISSGKYLIEEFFLPPGKTADGSGSNLALDLDLDDSHEAYKILSRFSWIPIPKLKLLVADAKWDKSAQPEQAVNHNYQHDLESIWWILFWVITDRVGCDTSSTAVVKLFTVDVDDFDARARALEKVFNIFEKSLHEHLQVFGGPMEALRAQMHRDYVTRPIVGHLELSQSYSKVHALFATKLREIQTTEGLWRTMKVVGKKDDTDSAAQVPPTVTGKRTRDALELEPRRSTRLRTNEGK